MNTVYIEINANYSRSVWDSSGATNYIAGDRVSYDDGVNDLIFVCLADNNSTTTPNNDSTNWVAAGSKDYPFQTKGILAFAGASPNNFPMPGAQQGELSLNEYDNNRQDASQYPSQPTNFAYEAAGPGGTIIFGDGDYATPTGASGNSFGAANITLKSLNFQKATLLTPYGFIVSGSKGPAQSSGPLVIDSFIQYRTYYNSGATGADSANTVTFRDCYITDEHPQSTYQNAATSDTSNGGNVGYVLNEFTFFYNCSIVHKRYNVRFLSYGGTANAENCTFYIQVASTTSGHSLFHSHNSNNPLNLKNCIVYVKHFYKSLFVNAFFGNTPSSTLDQVTWFIENNYSGVDPQAGSTVSYSDDLVRFVDPLFIDSDKSNFSLRPSSPLIGGLKKSSPLETKYPNAIWFDSNSNPVFQTYNFSLDSGDGNNYTFSGDATGSDPAISAETGDVLTFVNNTGGHPLEIQDADGNSVATESGGSLTFSTLRPGVYTYICQTHPSMSNTITITANVGLSENPTNSFASAVDFIRSNDNVIIVKNGTHTLVQSETGGSTTTSTLSLGGTANKLTIIGESTDKAILIANGTSWGTAFNAYGTNISLKLESLTLENHRDSHLGVITGGNNTSVAIESCKLLLAPSISTNNNGWFTGDANPNSSLIIKNSIVECAAAGGSSPKGALAGGGSEDNYNVFELVNNAFIIKTGSSPYLIDNNVGADLSSFIFKNNIFIGLTGTETIGLSSAMIQAAALTIKNNCYYNTGIDSSNALDSEGALFDEPKFLDAANGDYRLRPDSSLIGGAKKDPTNVYYLQPDNPYNGDGSQKDASSMTADGDAGPFNAFKNIVAAGVPYGSTVIILNGTYSWPLEFSSTRSSDITSTNWESYTFAGYNYVAETSNEVIFDAQGANKTFVYKPYGGTPGSGVYLDLDTSFTGIQLNNPVGSGDNTTGTRIATLSASAGFGSCTFNNCKFLGWINTSTYSWTGGGRTKYGSTMHWKGCSISVAFDTPASLFGGGDGGFADDAYHGAWSWENCTFYIPVGLTTFNGRNAANGTYASPNKLFGNTSNQSSRLFTNNIVYIPGGSCPLSFSSAYAHYLPQIQNNCFLGVDVSAHLDLILEKNNLVDVDPQFVDLSNNNFSLRPSSTLIGKG